MFLEWLLSKRFIKSLSQTVSDDVKLAETATPGIKTGWEKFADGLSNWWKGFTGSGLTQRDIDLNQMNMQNVMDQASAEVAGYKKAGINPALMFSGGSSIAPQASSSGSVGNMSELLQAIMLPAQIKNIVSQSQLNKDQGKALLLNAEANLQNAETAKGNLHVNERNAGVNEFRAETDKMRQEIEAYVAKYNLKLTDEQMRNLSASTANINKQTEQLDERLAIAKQNAKSSEVSALASLKSAIAKNREVAIQEKLMPFQRDLLDAQAYVEWANGEGKDIVNRYLDEQQQQQVAKNAEEIRRTSAQRKFYDSQTVRNYVNCATDVSDAVNRWFNPFAKGTSASPPAPFDLSGTYQVGAYGYD